MYFSALFKYLEINSAGEPGRCFFGPRLTSQLDQSTRRGAFTLNAVRTRRVCVWLGVSSDST